MYDISNKYLSQSEDEKKFFWCIHSVIDTDMVLVQRNSIIHECVYAAWKWLRSVLKVRTRIVEIVYECL